MIRRIFIDNYGCFQDFEWELGQIELLLGVNGSGKSSVFKVISRLKRVIVGGTATVDLFSRNQLNAWNEPLRAFQTFKVEIEINGGLYTYRLVIEHDLSFPDRNWIREEALTLDLKLLYSFTGRDVLIFNSDGSQAIVYPFDPSRSPLSSIPDRPETTALSWFTKWWHSTMTYAPDPLRMASVSDRDGIAAAEGGMEHLLSWLRHVQQEFPEISEQLRDSLKECLAGFESYSLPKVGESSRIMKLEFRHERSRKSYPLYFGQLSEGQRCLIALYLILHASVKQNATICMDEPDNFLALREIHPWLIHLKDRLEDTGAQLLLISHNPDVIDYLAPHHGTWFYRENGGSSQTKSFEEVKTGDYSPSEVIARDWVLVS